MSATSPTIARLASLVNLPRFIRSLLCTNIAYQLSLPALSGLNIIIRLGARNTLPKLQHLGHRPSSRANGRAKRNGHDGSGLGAGVIGWAAARKVPNLGA